MKITKSAANYSPVSDNPKTKCSGCAHFQKPNGCSKVEGSIAPGGWCKYWSKLKGLRAMMGA